MPRSRCGSLVAGVLLLGGAAAFTQQPASSVPPAPASAPLDVVVLDSSNRPVTSLRGTDFRVTVDGEARRVLSAQYVVKGHGAVAAARSLSAAAPLPVTAEASRVVLLAIDEDSVYRGSEKQVSEAAGRVIDNLAAGDQVLLVSLPFVPSSLRASVDRGTLRDGLGKVVGRAVPEAGMAQPAPALPPTNVEPPDDEVRIAGVRPPVADTRPDRGAPVEGMPRGASSPAALARLLASMSNLPGQKTVIVLSGGEHATAGAAAEPLEDGAQRVQFLAATDPAVGSRAVVHAVHVARAGSRLRDRDLERLATATGGRSVTVSGGARDLDPLDGAMAGSYLLQVERRPEDDRGPRGLRVTTTRRGVNVVAASRWTPRDDPPLPPQAATPAPSPDAAPPPVAVSPVRGRSRPAPRRDPELNAVLARVTDYLAGYIREFSNVVAEEVYLQHINLERPDSKLELRRLRSDLLIVQLGGSAGWIPYRDVFEVDGKPVRDRQERLEKLFLSGTEDALRQATRISEESARHNLGTIRRTVNIPTLALEFLLPGAIDRCNFSRKGDETVQGVRVWRVDFEEWGSPTVIRTGATGEDYPAGGSLWIEPVTGRIVKTRVRARNAKVSMESTVLFARNDALGIWTPFEMKEVYEQQGGKIDGDAKYLNFRRFKVTTEEAIKVPK